LGDTGWYPGDTGGSLLFGSLCLNAARGGEGEEHAKEVQSEDSSWRQASLRRGYVGWRKEEREANTEAGLEADKCQWISSDLDECWRLGLETEFI
jgi:hypothetical protein